MCEMYKIISKKIIMVQKKGKSIFCMAEEVLIENCSS